MFPEFNALVDPELKRQMRWRIEALERHIRFLARREFEDLIYVRARGWSDERLQILCELNAFYQIVLAPLASAARVRSDAGLGRDIPIQHGTRTFDREFAREMEQMMRSFMTRMRRLGVTQRILSASRADDLIEALATQLRGNDQR